MVLTDPLVLKIDLLGYKVYHRFGASVASLDKRCVIIHGAGGARRDGNEFGVGGGFEERQEGLEENEGAECVDLTADEYEGKRKIT